MTEALWYYEEAGKQAGPISHAAMSEAIRTGRLPPGSRVWRAGMAGWQPWEAVAELAALATPPPVAGPPPLGAPPGPPPSGWGPPPGGTAPFPPDSHAADLLRPGAPGALYPKAPLGARFLAALLDGVIAMGPAIVLGGATAGAFAADSTALGALLGLGFLAAALWSLYYGFTKDGRPNGQSIGKKTMGLMVVHLPSNQPCTRGQSAIRYLVLFGLNLIPYVGWLVEPVVVLATAGGRRLGDSAADTQVIALAAYQPRR